MSNTKTAQMIGADHYKPLLPKGRQAAALTTLRSEETLERARRVIAMKSAELRGAVVSLVEQLEKEAKAANWTEVFAMAHEIRGLAGTAGMGATGRIANGFCQYLDALHILGLAPEQLVVGLHVDAIARSARTQDDAARHGDTVAGELAALVSRKLAEIKE